MKLCAKKDQALVCTYVCATDTSYIVQQKVHHSSNSVVENCLKWLVMEIAFIVEYLILWLCQLLLIAFAQITLF